MGKKVARPECCGNCRFFKGDTKKPRKSQGHTVVYGSCRRFPPLAFIPSKKSVQPIWLQHHVPAGWAHPRRYDGQWCGEWAPLKDATDNRG